MTPQKRELQKLVSDNPEPDHVARRRELVQRFGPILEQLVRDHRRELLGFVVHAGVSRSDADEPVNDAFMAAFLLMERTGEPLQNPRGFLFGAASFRMMDYLRDRDRRRGRLERARQHAEAAPRLDPPDVTAVIDDCAELASQKEVLCALSTSQRKAFLLYHYYGFEKVEIAEVMGISRQAARTHLSRAEKKLADLAGKEEAS